MFCHSYALQKPKCDLFLAGTHPAAESGDHMSRETPVLIYEENSSLWVEDRFLAGSLLVEKKNKKLVLFHLLFLNLKKRLRSNVII